MIVKVAKISGDRVVKIVYDGDSRVAYDAMTGAYMTRVWRFKSRWMGPESNVKWNSMLEAVARNIGIQDVKRSLGVR